MLLKELILYRDWFFMNVIYTKLFELQKMGFCNVDKFFFFNCMKFRFLRLDNSNFFICPSKFELKSVDCIFTKESESGKTDRQTN